MKASTSDTSLFAISCEKSSSLPFVNRAWLVAAASPPCLLLSGLAFNELVASPTPAGHGLHRRKRREEFNRSI
jgi:hypothetical protein